MPNPYLPLMDQAAEILLSRDAVATAKQQAVGDFVHLDPDNEWVNTHLAGYLMTAAAAWQLPESRWHQSEQVAEYMRALAVEVVERGFDDRWYHREARKGDPNIDRFTLLPLTEAFLLSGKALGPELSARVRERILGVLTRQLDEYGSQERHRVYPNMDVYYCLIMLHGMRIGEGEQARRCSDEFERLMEIMQQAQFPDGGWTYIEGTNECPVYHNLNVMLMARVWLLTGDERAREMVRRSVPYYPLIVDPAGRPEYFTDPWWKHVWSPQEAFGPDTVASLTGDPENRAIGEQLREGLAGRLAEMKGQVALPMLVWAALAWQDVEHAGRRIETGVAYDANIEGPRGRFEQWSWAATARYGSDTLVGAVAHTDRNEPVAALMAVTAEVDRRLEGRPNETLQRWSLGITPPETKGETVIEGDRAVFTADYPLACYRAIWDFDYFPAKWRCRQRWEMDAEALRGEIELVSEADQDDAPPLVRVRLGRNLTMERRADGEIRCGPFSLRVEPGDFPHQEIKAVPTVPYLTTLDAVELVLHSGQAGPFKAGEALRCRVRVEYCG